MKSRAVSAIIFGLVFGILLSAITFFTPHIRTEQCGGDDIKTYKLPAGITIGGGHCDGGGSSETVGFPFAVKKATSPPSVSPQYLPQDQLDSGFKVQLPGLLGNVIAFGIVGFVFFFIFSRSRHKPNAKKARGSQK